MPVSHFFNSPVNHTPEYEVLPVCNNIVLTITSALYAGSVSHVLH